MSKLLPSTAALIEVFQTPRPTTESIARWKAGWKHTAGRVRVDNYSAGMKQLRAMTDIDPLFYQFAIGEDDDTMFATNATTYIVFFKPEHEAYFKMHQGLG